MGDVCLADWTEFLAVDEPGIDFVEMKNMVTWQLAYTVALFKLEEADCTFDLSFTPRNREMGVMRAGSTLFSSLEVDGT